MIGKLNITSAKYVKDVTNSNLISSIKATIDGKEWSVPINLDNTAYAEIKRQADAGELTIEDAD